MARWQAQGKYPGIFADADDPKHWRIVVNLGRAGKGEPRRRAVSVIHGTLTDAKAERTKLESRKNNKEIRPQKKSDASSNIQTVGQWFDYWLDVVKPTQKKKIEASTYARYRTTADLYILPSIGSRRLRTLSVQDIEDFYAFLRDEKRHNNGRGLHVNTQYGAAALLKQSLNRAAKTGKLARNPMLDVDDSEAPSRDKRRPFDDPLTEEQIRGLLEAMSDDPSLYAMVRLALFTGLREGELIALEWETVDIKEPATDADQWAGTVRVARAAKRVLGDAAGGPHIVASFGKPKTQNALRTVSLDPTTAKWLHQWRADLLATKNAAGPKYWTTADGDLVVPHLRHFGGQLAGRAWQPETLRKAFHRHADKVGLRKLRFHDLRHNYASQLLTRGNPPLVVSRMIGHAHISLTFDTYGHTSAEQHREAAATLGDILPD